MIGSFFRTYGPAIWYSITDPPPRILSLKLLHAALEVILTHPAQVQTPNTSGGGGRLKITALMSSMALQRFAVVLARVVNFGER